MIIFTISAEPEDEIAYDSAAAAAKNLPDLCNKLTEPDNFIWQELKGMHDFHIWYLGFFNFAQIALSKLTRGVILQ